MFKFLYTVQFTYILRMELNVDSCTVDLLLETIQFRIENDTALLYSPNIRSDLEDLLATMEGYSDEFL